MKKLHCLMSGLLGAALCLSGQVTFAKVEGTDQRNAESDGAGIRFFFGVKPWATTWDVPLLDTVVAIPNGGGAPVLLQYFVQAQSSLRVVPIISFGGRYQDFVVAGNFIPRSGYSTDGWTDQKVSRDERDFSVGYAFTPNLLGSIVYKQGNIGQAATRNTQQLLNTSISYKIDGLLVALNASAPIQDKLSLYGNFAIGQGRERVSYGDGAGATSWDGIYKIGEIGLAYRLYDRSQGASGLNSVSLQVGYRAQTVSIRGAEAATRSTTAPFPVVSTEKHNISSTTEGLIAGLVATF